MVFEIPRWYMEKKSLKGLMMLVKSLMIEPRRSIFQILDDETKSTEEIYIELETRGIKIPQSTLYYHLSTLRNLGIIEMAGYREEGGGAPKKLWKLKVKKVGINLISGEIFKD